MDTTIVPTQSFYFCKDQNYIRRTHPTCLQSYCSQQCIEYFLQITKFTNRKYHSNYIIIIKTNCKIHLAKSGSIPCLVLQSSPFLQAFHEFGMGVGVSNLVQCFTDRLGHISRTPGDKNTSCKENLACIMNLITQTRCFFILNLM